jgi:hypothetical protein
MVKAEKQAGENLIKPVIRTLQNLTFGPSKIMVFDGKNVKKCSF